MIGAFNELIIIVRLFKNTLNDAYDDDEKVYEVGLPPHVSHTSSHDLGTNHITPEGICLS